MNEELLKQLYEEYLAKKVDIFKEHGESDGFLISGENWWDYYKKLIYSVIEKYKENSIKENDIREFYNNFGFGPKVYVNSFLENGIQKIIETFIFLMDDSIGSEDKLEKTIEDPDSSYKLVGAGSNFITLFLTVVFPEKYAQWNRKVDDALIILDAHPIIKRGTKNPQKYTIVNERIISISKKLNENFLPKIDNFLFSLSQGYIGEKEGISNTIDKEVASVEKDVEEDNIPKEDRKKYLEIQYLLIEIGKKKGYGVWVASNDRNENYAGIKFSELALDTLPIFGPQRAISISKWIDVIWFEEGSSKPVRFFEIEHSTSVYSGLLRLNDIFMDYPIPRATIVVPKGRLDKVNKEINRPTFQALSELCDILSYEDVKDWHEATQKIEKYK